MNKMDEETLRVMNKNFEIIMRDLNTRLTNIEYEIKKMQEETKNR